MHVDVFTQRHRRPDPGAWFGRPIGQDEKWPGCAGPFFRPDKNIRLAQVMPWACSTPFAACPIWEACELRARDFGDGTGDHTAITDFHGLGARRMQKKHPALA